MFRGQWSLFSGLTRRWRWQKSSEERQDSPSFIVPPAVRASRGNSSSPNETSSVTDAGSSPPGAPPGDSIELILDKSEGGTLSDVDQEIQDKAQIPPANAENPNFISSQPHHCPESPTAIATDIPPTQNSTAIMPKDTRYNPARAPPTLPRALSTSLFGGNNGPTDSTKDLGIYVLAQGRDPQVDIITIHGLDGHRLGSFTEGKVCWPRDLLPITCPQARIATFGYNAATGGADDQLSSQCLYSHGANLITKLVQWRQKTQTDHHRPIMFIAYSVGGLVLKHALMVASDASSSDALMHSIKLATYGIIFLGTPHQGVPCGDLQEFISNVSAIAKKAVVKDMQLHSEHIYQQLDSFTNISGDFETKLAYETLMTRLPDKKLVMLVPKGTAVLPGAVDTEAIGMNKNHYSIAKFADEEDDDYKVIAYWLTYMIRNAPARIQSNFVATAQVILTAPVEVPSKPPSYNASAISEASHPNNAVRTAPNGHNNRTPSRQTQSSGSRYPASLANEKGTVNRSSTSGRPSRAA